MTRRYAAGRREFLKYAGSAVAGLHATGWLASQRGLADESTSGELASTVEILNPRCRVPLSFIVDDSTCLVNMAHFAMPQFAEAWPDREIYRKPWNTWPREIPDDFVREFGDWCAGEGVRGKYSIVPYPACVGWLDRALPGWSRAELDRSLKLVREVMLPNWDIHPEMITHTRIIDLNTGRPMEMANSATMENSFPQSDISTDHLASYLAYALRILKNCGLPCEGVTTPGGFGNRVKSQLPIAVHQAVRDVYGTDLPHYFKYVVDDAESVEPRLEYVDGMRDPTRLTINVPAATGDWFGGWDGMRASEPDRYATKDGTAGRMIDVIERGGPAVMLCHWPGMYCNGTKSGFHAFQQVVRAIRSAYSERTQWMKVSEIGRYWAAKNLTRITRASSGQLSLTAPYACHDFTIRWSHRITQSPSIGSGTERTALIRVNALTELREGTFHEADGEATLCFALPKGTTHIDFRDSVEP